MTAASRVTVHARLVDAERRESGNRVGLGGKHVSVRRFAGPMSTRADQLPSGRSERRHARELILGTSAPIGLPKLEQGAVGEASVAVSLRGGDQPRQQRRTHLPTCSVEIGLLSVSSGCPPPNSFASSGGMNDQVTASTSPRAASTRRVSLWRFCASVSTGLATPASRGIRRCRHFIDAGEPHHFLDQVGGAGNVRPPRRRRDLETFALAVERMPSAASMALDLPCSSVEPAQALNQAEIEIERLVGLGRLAGDRDLARLAAAKFEHQLCGQLEPRHDEIGIDAALESVARVGVDAELAPGARRALRIEIGGLDEDVGGRLGDAGLLAAHDAAKPEHARVVGDHAHARRPPHRSCRRGRRSFSPFAAEPRADGRP